MTQLRCRFDFHPVGQGLFYSGVVNMHNNINNELAFVYDCGSMSTKKLHEPIASLCKQTKQLKFVIISHFHEDHINGIQELSSNLTIDTAILPYLHPAERLLTAAGYAIKNRLNSITDDYISFISDPAAYLLKKVSSVVFLLPPNGLASDETPAGDPADETGWYPQAPLSTELYPDIPDDERVSLRWHDSRYESHPHGWGFKFFCTPHLGAEEQIRSRLKDIRIDDSGTSIANALRTRLKEIKSIYKDIFGASNQNSISLLCCHGPTMLSGRWFHFSGSMYLRGYDNSSKALASGHWRFDSRSDHHLEYRIHKQSIPRSRRDFLAAPLQLLTGDAEIDLADLRRYFRDDIQSIGLALAPHHGSKKNWDSLLCRMLSNCQAWVFSFGLGNRHGHPSMEAIDHIALAQQKTLLCNELAGITIKVNGIVHR